MLVAQLLALGMVVREMLHMEDFSEKAEKPDPLQGLSRKELMKALPASAWMAAGLGPAPEQDGGLQGLGLPEKLQMPPPSGGALPKVQKTTPPTTEPPMVPPWIKKGRIVNADELPPPDPRLQHHSPAPELRRRSCSEE